MKVNTPTFADDTGRPNTPRALSGRTMLTAVAGADTMGSMGLAGEEKMSLQDTPAIDNPAFNHRSAADLKKIFKKAVAKVDIANKVLDNDICKIISNIYLLCLFRCVDEDPKARVGSIKLIGEMGVIDEMGEAETRGGAKWDEFDGKGEVEGDQVTADLIAIATRQVDEIRDEDNYDLEIVPRIEPGNIFYILDKQERNTKGNSNYYYGQGLFPPASPTSLFQKIPFSYWIRRSLVDVDSVEDWGSINMYARVTRGPMTGELYYISYDVSVDMYLGAPLSRDAPYSIIVDQFGNPVLMNF